MGSGEQSSPAPHARRISGARWAPFLPRLVIAAGAHLAPARQELRALAYADFRLGAVAPLPAPIAHIVVEPAVAGPMPPSAIPDRDAPCLTEARRLAVERVLAEPERARSYVERARRAAWLPELRLRIDRRLGRSESVDLPGTSGGTLPPIGLDSDDDVRYEARATWDLSKLVFNAEELAAESQALRMADMRREIESLTNRLYFERRRLVLETRFDSPDDAEPAVRRTVRLEELEAELDVLSGGAFARCTAGSAVRHQP